VTAAIGVEEQRVNVIIDITDPPEKWAKLGHGYRVIIRVVEWESTNAPQLPISALFRDKGKWAVFAVQNGRAKLVPVTIGRMNDEQAVLLGGLKKGAVVILHPSEKISDDARVKAR
jgi:HlyD family secretion protein